MGNFVFKNLVETTKSPAWSGGKIHPLELSLSVQKCMTDQDILVFDGGILTFGLKLLLILQDPMD